MTDIKRVNDAIVVGDLPDDILDAVLNIAHGRFRFDKNFINQPCTGEELLTSLSTFERGPKEGHCILSGAVIDPPMGSKGTQRVAINMTKNYLLMVDLDQGDTVDEIIEKIRPLKLFAVVWTTHSHMKAETEATEKQVIHWLKEQSVTTSDPTQEQVLDYLRDCAKIRGEFLTDATVLGREMIAGQGRTYRIRVQPKPRCRALFALKEPFDFANRPGSQQQAIEEWKALYAGFCENVLQVTYDSQCVDPSRLMYLPRIAPDADITKHEIKVLPGDFLDLETVPKKEKHRPAQIANAFTQAAQKAGVSVSGTFKTPGLAAFLAKHADDFQAADWLRDHDDAMQCPWADRHTPTATGVDTGFGVKNASMGEGFGLWCLHSCGSDPQRGQNAQGKQDRGKYLDELCVKFNIADANALIPYCPNAETRTEETRQTGEQVLQRQAQVVETAQNDSAIEERIRSFSAQTPHEDITGILRLLAARPQTDRIRVSQLVGLLCDNTGARRGDTDKALTALRKQFAREQADARAAAAAEAGVEILPTQHNLPESVEDITAIWDDWHFRDQTLWATRWLTHENRKNPRIFTRPEGGLLRVEDAGDRTVVIEMTTGKWAAAMNRYLVFNETITTPDGVRTERGVAPFKPLVTELANREWDKGDFPMLDRIVRVPVFGPDGTLRTERGYDAELQVYLDPDEVLNKMPEVPTNPTEAQVEAACNWLIEVGRDFPFSDYFDGETLPVKSDQLPDENGYVEPNWARGRVSRLHYIAALIQPFVRNMIKGPCPAYAIVKPIAGAGAGYMADGISIIAEGQRAGAQPMSENNEEFRKSITATLRSGVGIIFVDNLMRTVDSGDLAAAITAGSWRDRVIMSSNIVDIPVKALWLFAGNRARFTDELSRRIVPIKIDPAVENATLDRPPETYKHPFYQDWLGENRSMLVWSALTLIANWIAIGKPPGGTVLQSFNNYAAVMSGILMAAGLCDHQDVWDQWKKEQHLPWKAKKEVCDTAVTRWEAAGRKHADKPNGDPGPEPEMPITFLGTRDRWAAASLTQTEGAKMLLQLAYDRFGAASFAGKDLLAAATDAFGNMTVDLPVDSKNDAQRAKQLRAYLDEFAVDKTFQLCERGGEADGLGSVRVKFLIRRKEAPVKYGFFVL